MSEKTKYALAVTAAILLVGLIFAIRDPDAAVDANKHQDNTAAQTVNATPDNVSDKTDADTLRFRNSDLLMQHYEKHGKDMGFSSAEDYERAAAAVPSNPNVMHKTEKDDGDDVYYIRETNEFVIVSTDGYIRTYFLPDSGIKYFNKQ